MTFTLITINTAHDETHPDKVFSSMEQMIAFLQQSGIKWISLVVTVLP